MSILFRLSAFALLLLASSASAQTSKKPAQYLLISFDGASSIEQWQRSRSLAERAGAQFTYFLSCVYLLSPETRSFYKAPSPAPRHSNVGFGLSREDVRARLDEIWYARAEGHEIASHGCGHFDGGEWSASDWEHEFGQFHTIVRDAWKINGFHGEPAGWRDFAEHEIKGFRAPYLATGASLFQVLARNGFLYDASTVTRGPAKPELKSGITRFSLPLIPEGPNGRNLIAMDYNFYVRHSGGKEQLHDAAIFEERALDAFLSAFKQEYENARTPLQIGFHFTLMNGGAYWRALERFAEQVCTLQDVHCISYRAYLDRSMQPLSGH